MKHFPGNLERLRLSLNLTQEQMAVKVGGSRSALAAYEKGDRTPKIDVMENIINLSGRSREDFLNKPLKFNKSKEAIDVSREITVRFMKCLYEIIGKNKASGGQYSTAKKFATSVGINPLYISQYNPPTNRNVQIENIHLICTVHKVNANWLITGKGPQYLVYEEKSEGQRLKNIEDEITKLKAVVKVLEGRKSGLKELKDVPNLPPDLPKHA